MVFPPGVMNAVGKGLTVTLVAADVAEQPFPFVTLTSKLPDALTVMDCVVEPSDHK